MENSDRRQNCQSKVWWISAEMSGRVRCAVFLQNQFQFFLNLTLFFQSNCPIRYIQGWPRLETIWWRFCLLFFVCLYTCMLSFLSVWLSVSISLYLYLFASVCLSVSVSVCLSSFWHPLAFVDLICLPFFPNSFFLSPSTSVLLDCPSIFSHSLSFSLSLSLSLSLSHFLCL